MSDETWRSFALHLRGVLDEVGVSLPPCMPGEKQECGYDVPHHAMNYAAALAAKTEEGLWLTHHGDPDGVALAADLLEHWRGIFRREGCVSWPGV